MEVDREAAASLSSHLYSSNLHLIPCAISEHRLSTMSSLLTRIGLTFPAFFTAFGSFAFDFNETHVLNPNWPPHARFHNGQTMSMSAVLCIACIYFTWWRLPLHLSRGKNGKAAARDLLAVIWVLGSAYCATGLSAVLYPGSSGVRFCRAVLIENEVSVDACAQVDPEFYEESIGDFPQKWIFGLPLLVNAAAFWWEWRKLGEEGTKTS